MLDGEELLFKGLCCCSFDLSAVAVLELSSESFEGILNLSFFVLSLSKYAFICLVESLLLVFELVVLLLLVLADLKLHVLLVNTTEFPVF